MVFLFGTMCSLRERDAHCVRDASFGREVRFARELEHITSLRPSGATLLCEAQHHGGEAAASLYKADFAIFSESLPFLYFILFFTDCCRCIPEIPFISTAKLINIRIPNR